MLGLLGVMREVVGGLKIGVLLPGTDRVIEGSSYLGVKYPTLKISVITRVVKFCDVSRC